MKKDRKETKNKRKGSDWPSALAHLLLLTLSPSRHLHLSIHLCIVTHNNSPPPGSAAWAFAKIALFLPASLPPYSSCPSLGAPSLSGLCQSNEQTLNCCAAREQMGLWEDLQHTETEKKEGRGQLSCKGEDKMHFQTVPLAGKTRNMPHICTFFQFISYWIKASDSWTPFRRIQRRKKREAEWEREIHVSDGGWNLWYSLFMKQFHCENESSGWWRRWGWLERGRLWRRNRNDFARLFPWYNQSGSQLYLWLSCDLSVAAGTPSPTHWEGTVMLPKTKGGSH